MVIQPDEHWACATKTPALELQHEKRKYEHQDFKATVRLLSTGNMLDKHPRRAEKQPKKMIGKQNKTTRCVVYTAVNVIIKKNKKQNRFSQPAANMGELLQ